MQKHRERAKKKKKEGKKELLHAAIDVLMK